LRRLAAAFAVLVLHVLAIRALLDMRALFYRPAEAQEPSVTTWVLLPSEPAQRPEVAPSRPVAGLPMERLIDESANPAARARPALRPLPLVPPLALPSLAPQTVLDARVSSALAADFACSFDNYDRLSDDERARCALRLSNLGDLEVLPGAYVDRKDSPFTLFGAHGAFRLAPPAQSTTDPLVLATGCTWEQGLCRLPYPAKFGLDPDDPSRFTAAATFELAKGLSLDVGGQGYMQNYLGGARLIYAAGVVLTYRW
jgi:hypothetical protein